MPDRPREQMVAIIADAVANAQRDEAPGTDTFALVDASLFSSAVLTHVTGAPSGAGYGRLSFAAAIEWLEDYGIRVVDGETQQVEQEYVVRVTVGGEISMSVYATSAVEAEERALEAVQDDPLDLDYDTWVTHDPNDRVRGAA